MTLSNRIVLLLTLLPIICTGQIKRVRICYPIINSKIALADSNKYNQLQVALVMAAKQDANIEAKFIEIDSTPQNFFLNYTFSEKLKTPSKRVYFFKLVDSESDIQVELFNVNFPEEKLLKYGKVLIPKKVSPFSHISLYIDSIFFRDDKFGNSNIFNEQKCINFISELKLRRNTSQIPTNINNINFDPANDKYKGNDNLKIAIQIITNFIEKLEYLNKNNVKIDPDKFKLNNFISGRVNKSLLEKEHRVTFMLYNYCYFLKDYIIQKSKKNFDYNTYSRIQLDYLNTLILQTDTKLGSKENRLWRSNSINFNEARIALRKLTILNLEECDYLKKTVDTLRKQKNFDLALDAFKRRCTNCPFSNMDKELNALIVERDQYKSGELNKLYAINDSITRKAIIYDKVNKTNQLFYQLGELNDGIGFMFKVSEDSTMYKVNITIGQSNSIKNIQNISYYPPGEPSTKLSPKYFDIVSSIILKYSEIFKCKPGSNRYIVNIIGSSDAIPFNGKLKVKNKSAFKEKFLDNTSYIYDKANRGKITSLNELSSSSDENNLGLAFLRAYEFKHYLNLLNIDLNNSIITEFHKNDTGGAFRAVEIEITVYTN